MKHILHTSMRFIWVFIALIVCVCFSLRAFAQTIRAGGWIDQNRDVIKNSQWFTSHAYQDCPADNSGYWPTNVFDCLISDQAPGPLPPDSLVAADPPGLYYKHFLPTDFFPIAVNNIGMPPFPPTITSLQAYIQHAVTMNPAAYAHVSLDSLYVGLQGDKAGTTVRTVSLMVHPLIERPIVNAIGLSTRVANLYQPFLSQATGIQVNLTDAVTLYKAALYSCGRQALNNDQSGRDVYVVIGSYIAIVEQWDNTSSLSVDDCLIHVVHPITRLSMAPTISVVPKPSPSVSIPSASPSPVGYFITTKVLLHGLGSAGDNANPHGTGTKQPLHTQRTGVLSFIDANNQFVASTAGNVLFDSRTGVFSGVFALPHIQAGSYILSVAIPGYLSGQFPGIISVKQASLTLPPISLVTGDINHDNQLDILDYNLLVSCFGSKAATASCQENTAADLTDDGVIDGSDYNLFLRELSVQKGV